MYTQLPGEISSPLANKKTNPANLIFFGMVVGAASKQSCSVSRETTDGQLPEGCFGPTKYDNSGTFAQICL